MNIALGIIVLACALIFFFGEYIASLSSTKPIKDKCEICQAEFDDESKTSIFKTNNQKLVVCSRCADWTENRRSMEKLDEFWDKNFTQNPSPANFVRNSIPREVKAEVWQRDRGQCVACGANDNLEYDHIIPVSKGGASTGRNLQILCESCHRSKNRSVDS